MTTTTTKSLATSMSRGSHKSTNCGRKVEAVRTSGQTSSVQMRIPSNPTMNKMSNTEANSRRAGSLTKRSADHRLNENASSEDAFKKSQICTNRNTLNIHNASRVPSTNVSQESAASSRFRYYGNRTRDVSSPRYDYKSNGAPISGSGYSDHAANAQISHRDDPPVSMNSQTTRTSRNDNSSFVAARKALEQQNLAHQSAANFGAFRGSQNLVEMRPFVNEARSKQQQLQHGGEVGACNAKVKGNEANASRGNKDASSSYPGNQTFHGYGGSSITGIGVQSVPNVQPANITPYVRSDSYAAGPTLANVLFPETPRFSQTSNYNHNQVGQLGQYHQTYDPSSYASTPVNSVMTQYSPESTITYPQYENPPQFVQTNHYATSDIGNSQYPFQATGVGQIQETPLFLQSLPSPIAVTDQYAASNYARAVRTELLPRLRGPPRFNK